MNNVKKSIGWSDYTWNPITGCMEGCDYCYAKKIYKRFHKSFQPTFHTERMKEIDKMNKPAKIFLGSVTDMFGTTGNLQLLSDKNDILDKIREYKYAHLTFQLLTKHPENIVFGDAPLPANIWVGTTVTQAREWYRIKHLKEAFYGGLKFVSFEPVLDDVADEGEGGLDLEGIKWAIIGILTGKKLESFDIEWIDSLVRNCDKYSIPIYMKNSLKNYYPKLRQEFPINPPKD